MILRYDFGTPFATGACVLELPPEKGDPLFFSVERDRRQVTLSLSLGREDMLALRNILERFPGPVETHAQVRLDGHLCLLHLDAALKVSPGPELDKALTAWAS